MKNLHKLITNDQYDIGGLCTEPKGNVIKSLVKDSNAKLCVEIGVFKGSSLLYFAEAIIYNVLFKEQTTLDNLYSNLTQIIEENKLNNVVKLIRDKSENYYQNIKSESIDVLHIDGNHDEEYVSKDILNYLPLVKKGGYIIMDDITWVGVKNSINNHLINSCHLMSDHVDFSVYIKD